MGSKEVDDKVKIRENYDDVLNSVVARWHQGILSGGWVFTVYSIHNLSATDSVINIKGLQVDNWGLDTRGMQLHW